MAYLRSKSTGAIINRTLEMMPCAYTIEGPYLDEDGKIQIAEYPDYEDFMDEVKQQENEKGERLFLDENGDEYPESDLELVEGEPGDEDGVEEDE